MGAFRLVTANVCKIVLRQIYFSMLTKIWFCYEENVVFVWRYGCLPNFRLSPAYECKNIVRHATYTFRCLLKYDSCCIRVRSIFHLSSVCEHKISLSLCVVTTTALGTYAIQGTHSNKEVQKYYEKAELDRVRRRYDMARWQYPDALEGKPT